MVTENRSIRNTAFGVSALAGGTRARFLRPPEFVAVAALESFEGLFARFRNAALVALYGSGLFPTEFARANVAGQDIVSRRRVLPIVQAATGTRYPVPNAKPNETRQKCARCALIDGAP